MNVAKQAAATFGLEFSPLYRTIFLYYLILGLALLTAFVTIRLRRLPIGRAWEALREDEIACRSLGINTTTTKLTALSPALCLPPSPGASASTGNSPSRLALIRSSIKYYY